MKQRKSIVRTAAVCVVAAIAAIYVIGAGADGGRENGSQFQYAIGLWGDLPYNDLQAQVGVPNLIADMNRQPLAFTVNDGDLKGGNGIPNSVTTTTCADLLYTQALGYFDQLKAPAMFTPGDNDWTDCDRPSNGGFNSLARLDHEREVLFATSSSLGQRKLQQDVQTAPLCLNAAGTLVGCVENRRWLYKDVVYVTVNFQGSCNNLCDTAPDPNEFAARNAANIAWVDGAFDLAAARGASAVMVIGQADPGFDGSDATRAPTRDPKTLAETDANSGANDGYQSFLTALRARTISFKRPVVYVHGDSHYFRIDKPLQDSAGLRVENFTRVETYGDNAANGLNDVHWVKVLVDPGSRDVFAFQPQVVPANRVAVPAP